MAVIGLPDQSPVELSRWAFRLLLERATAEVAEHHSTQYGDLNHGQTSSSCGRRWPWTASIATSAHKRTIGKPFASPRWSPAKPPLSDQAPPPPGADQRDQEFAEILGSLAMHLDGFWMTESIKPQYLTKLIVQAPAPGRFPLWIPGSPEVDLIRPPCRSRPSWWPAS